MAKISFAEYMTNLEIASKRVSEESIFKMIREITKAKSSTIFIIGNGGSAAIASHFATDLLRTFELNQSKVRVFSLVDNSPLILASGNDFGFENIFARQLAQYGFKGDILIAISSSGNSENIIKAVDTAKQKDLVTIGMSGFTGGKLANLVDISVHVSTESGEYEMVEDIHASICHFVSKSIRFQLGDFGLV